MRVESSSREYKPARQPIRLLESITAYYNHRHFVQKLHQRLRKTTLNRAEWTYISSVTLFLNSHLCSYDFLGSIRFFTGRGSVEIKGRGYLYKTVFKGSKFYNQWFEGTEIFTTDLHGIKHKCLQFAPDCTILTLKMSKFPIAGGGNPLTLPCETFPLQLYQLSLVTNVLMLNHAITISSTTDYVMSFVKYLYIFSTFVV